MRLIEITKDAKYKVIDEANIFEKDIEDLIEKYPQEILDEKILIIYRQLLIESGKKLDLLGIDEAGNSVVIELKRDVTPREVFSQATDYTTFIRKMKFRDFEAFYDKYKLHDRYSDHRLLPAAFKSYFKCDTLPEFNKLVRCIIVCGEIDEELRKKIEDENEHPTRKIDVRRIKVFIESDRQYICTEPIIQAEIGFRKQKETRSFIIADPDFFEKIKLKLHEHIPENLKDFNTELAYTKTSSWNRIFWGASHKEVKYFFGIEVLQNEIEIYCALSSELKKWLLPNFDLLKSKYGQDLNLWKDDVIYKTIINKNIDHLTDNDFNLIINILVQWIVELKPEFDKS